MKHYYMRGGYFEKDKKCDLLFERTLFHNAIKKSASYASCIVSQPALHKPKFVLLKYEDDHCRN